MLCWCRLDAGETAEITAGDREFELTSELLEIKMEQQKLSGR